jgi:uncharacterized protein YdeI (YjbR/CyaY-like superfamily)
MKRDPRIDQKIAQAAPFARPILERLRQLVHRTIPTAEEAIKWGMPHFTYNGKNVAGMASFKAHCSFSIHGENHEGEGMGTLGKIASLDDLSSDAELAERLAAAKDRIDRGEKPASRQAPPKPKPVIGVPQDFDAALRANPTAAQFFDGLAPSHRYEYLEWITGAKRDETRVKRINQAIEWLAAGKRRNWKYER